mmetsp:Transcript_4759/g.9122  ORF Transcript_4759/g.9122 Transcript_4759/m.9122 type:complete len:80 (-) Transcript_4759:14-253(-)
MVDNIGMQGGNNPPLSGDDLLALGFDLQGRQFIEISIDVSPIGLFSTNSGLVWPNVNSTLRMSLLDDPNNVVPGTDAAV